MNAAVGCSTVARSTLLNQHRQKLGNDCQSKITSSIQSSTLVVDWAHVSSHLVFLRYLTCHISAGLARDLMQAPMTPEIAAEVAPSQYQVVLAPPNNIRVGNMFLVRVRVGTSSGSPLANVRLRVGIKALSSTWPRSMSPRLLQLLAVQGNSIGVLADQNVALDPSTSVRVSDGDGMISFPLTVIRAQSGTYRLHFQPDVPDSKIALETSDFKVENSFAVEVASSFSEIEISEFGAVVEVPKAPRICVTYRGVSKSLEELQAEGEFISMTLRLKAVPTEKESHVAKLVRDAKTYVHREALAKANAMAERFTQNSNDDLRLAARRLIYNHNKKARGMFAGLSEPFAEACSDGLTERLQRGDPALENFFGDESVASLNPS